MDRSEAGLSIVEIMVSMVILSVVMLVMTNVVMVSTMERGKSDNSDLGNLIAREKLAQLQDPNNLASDGSDEVVKKGITFTRTWELTASEPILATVRVSWTADSRGHATEAAGYLEVGNVCMSIVPNTAPSDIILYDGDGNEITDTIKIGHGTSENQFVARAYGVDKDSSKGDMITLSFLSGASNFQLRGDTIKTGHLMNAENTAYDVRIQASDCADNKVFRDFIVWVGAPTTKPKLDGRQTFTLYENNSDEESVGFVQANVGESNITWNHSAVNFTVDESSGEIKVKSGYSFNYETTPVDSFQVAAMRDGEDSTIWVVVEIKDTNDAPVELKLSSSTISVDASGEDVVGELSVVDPDSNSGKSSWYTYSYPYQVSENGNFKVITNINVTTVQVATGVTLSEGTEDITVVASENGGNSISKTFTITVTGSGGGAGGCSDPWDPNDSWTYYSVGDLRENNSKLWKVKDPQWAQSYAPSSAAGQQYGWTYVGECP